MNEQNVNNSGQDQNTNPIPEEQMSNANNSFGGQGLTEEAQEDRPAGNSPIYNTGPDETDDDGDVNEELDETDDSDPDPLGGDFDSSDNDQGGNGAETIESDQSDDRDIPFSANDADQLIADDDELDSEDQQDQPAGDAAKSRLI